MPQMSPILWENLNWLTVIMVLLVSTTMFFLMMNLTSSSNKVNSHSSVKYKGATEISWSW